jgi:hypothetical protein
MAKTDPQVEELIVMVKNFDFGYLIMDDLDNWKQGVNKEYLVKKLLHEVLTKYGFENWKKLETAILKATPQILYHNIEQETIHNWFLPYNKPPETKNAPSAYKFQNHQSLKNGTTDRMS